MEAVKLVLLEANQKFTIWSRSHFLSFSTTASSSIKPNDNYIVVALWWHVLQLLCPGRNPVDTLRQEKSLSDLTDLEGDPVCSHFIEQNHGPRSNQSEPCYG